MLMDLLFMIITNIILLDNYSEFHLPTILAKDYCF